MQISLEYGTILILGTLNIIIGFLYFQSLLRLRESTKNTIDLVLTNFAMQESGSVKESDVSDIHQENFIKFLSDSRDWAFDYIDKSQKQIKQFTDIADKQFAFFDSYGVLTEGDLFHDNMKVISEEYKKLKSLLPEESDDRR
jgi:hypothetical protein